MKTETKKKICEASLYLLLLLACILLIINFILLKSDAGECVKNPKEFLLKHFEKITGGNITCTCLSDIMIDRTSSERGRGNKIIFSSHGYNEDGGFTGKFYKNISINPPL